MYMTVYSLNGIMTKLYSPHTEAMYMYNTKTVGDSYSALIINVYMHTQYY